MITTSYNLEINQQLKLMLVAKWNHWLRDLCFSITFSADPKYSLLKNEKDLTETQKIKLEAIKENFPSLKKMQELKEEFRKI